MSSKLRILSIVIAIDLVLASIWGWGYYEGAVDAREVHKHSDKPAIAKKSNHNGLVVVGETVTVVTKMPFEIFAPDKYKIYYWHVPTSWKTEEILRSSHKVKVLEAPEGTAQVIAECFDKDLNVKVMRLSVNVGKVTPPKPPVPPDPPVPPVPPPDDELVKSLKAAYNNDAGSTEEKSRHLANLTGVWKEAATLAKDQGITTTGFWLLKVREKSNTSLPSPDTLRLTRVEIANYLNKRLPRDPNKALDAPTRDLLHTEASKVAGSLYAIK